MITYIIKALLVEYRIHFHHFMTTNLKRLPQKIKQMEIFDHPITQLLLA